MVVFKTLPAPPPYKPPPIPTLPPPPPIIKKSITTLNEITDTIDKKPKLELSPHPEGIITPIDISPSEAKRQQMIESNLTLEQLKKTESYINALMEYEKDNDRTFIENVVVKGYKIYKICKIINKFLSLSLI